MDSSSQIPLGFSLLLKSPCSFLRVGQPSASGAHCPASSIWCVQKTERQVGGDTAGWRKTRFCVLEMVLSILGLRSCHGGCLSRTLLPSGLCGMASKVQIFCWCLLDGLRHV